jgi:predicted dehydrogenase
VKVAVIGCGRAGARRARTLGDAQLAACVDTDLPRAQALARTTPGCVALGDCRAVLEDPRVGLVIIATPHDSLASLTARAVDAGKHVLVEKPAGCSVSELTEVAGRLERSRSLVRVGFNHRYHRAVRKAREMVSEGLLGPLMFVRGRYGHGGRPGYEREWRGQTAARGGGELLDQGVHLIDLARCFLGDFAQVQGSLHTYFWDMPADDNAFLLLKTSAGATAFLHASCTEWKNTFSFEVYGRAGKLHVEGLGGSYGTERLSWYRLDEEMGPPQTQIWEYPMEDDSWAVETHELLEDLRLGRPPAVSLGDALAALQIVERLRQKSRHDPDA